jgi:hypothetical protein
MLPVRVVIEVEPSKTRTHLLRWHVDEDASRALPYGTKGWVHKPVCTRTSFIHTAFITLYPVFLPESKPRIPPYIPSVLWL